jgi:hypothetical protein
MSSRQRRRVWTNCTSQNKLIQRPHNFIPPASSETGWFTRVIEVADLIARARDFLVLFQHGRRPLDPSGIEKLEEDLENYQMTVAIDNLLPIRDTKFFDKSKVVYLLLSYVYVLKNSNLVLLYSSISLDRTTKFQDVHTGWHVSTSPRKQCQ